MAWQAKNQSVFYRGNQIFVDLTIYYFDDTTGELIATRPISANCPSTNPNARDKLLNDLYKLADDMKAEILTQSQAELNIGDLTADVEIHLQGA